MKAGLRFLRRNPVFAAAAIFTIALGMGANTAVFTVIETVLLRPLPFREPDRLVMIWETHPELARLQAAAPDYADWRASAQSFDRMCAYSMQLSGKATVSGPNEPFQAQSTTASHDLFSMLGVAPAAGRWMTKAEEDGHQRVMLISENVWRNRFAADPATIGRAVRIGPDSFTIVGVVPQASAFPIWADLWLPFSFLDSGTVNERRFHPLEVVARLKPGASEAQAQAEMSAIAARLSRQYPATNKTIGASVVSLDSQTTGEVRPALIAIWGAVGLILLIACVNVAHLMLARAAAQSREAAIRTALGANAGNLIRHALFESLTLSVLGGALGILLAETALPLLQTLAVGQIPRMEGLALDNRVLAFSFLLMLAAGLLFGIAPALRGIHVPANDAMKSGGSVVRSGGLGRSLVIVEIALAVIVLSGAGLLLRSYARVLGGSAGIRPDHLLTVTLNLPVDGTKFENLFYSDIAPRLRALPGVTTVASANAIPMGMARTERSRWATRFGLPGRSYHPGQFPVAQIRFVTPGYLDAMGIALKQGRDLTMEDRNQPTFLINETLAQTYFAGQNPVGQSLMMGVVSPNPQPVRIVGVVEDVRELGLDVAPPPALYAAGSGEMILLRTTGDPAQLAGAVRGAIAAINPEYITGRIRTMDSVVADSLARRRFALILLGLFAAIAGLLAMVGIYGVVSYSVATRTREMGLRMALGAQRAQVLGLVMREGGVNLLIGLALGLAGTAGGARLLSTLLYDTSAFDPLALGGACLLFAFTALAAISIPARRATLVDPMIALREQ